MQIVGCRQRHVPVAKVVLGFVCRSLFLHLWDERLLHFKFCNSYCTGVETTADSSHGCSCITFDSTGGVVRYSSLSDVASALSRLIMQSVLIITVRVVVCARTRCL
jgi:hypothetical protein